MTTSDEAYRERTAAIMQLSAVLEGVHDQLSRLNIAVSSRRMMDRWDEMDRTLRVLEEREDEI